MTWGSPYSLWLLLAVPLYYGMARGRLRKIRKQRNSCFSEGAQNVVLASSRPKTQTTRLGLRTAALALLIVCLARPQWGYHLEDVSREGLDILIVLDTSRSMLAEDIRPNRLAAAKFGIRDLLQELDGDRIGLLAFAGSSFLQCPLTIDYSAFRLAMEDTYIGIIPRGGTAIEQALSEAIDSFGKQEESTKSDRVIILITDGDDHEGDPLNLIPRLKEENIKLFSVGVGSLQGELIPAAGTDQSGFLKNRQGEVVKSSLNEDMLSRLATETGGLYVRSAPGDFGLEQIYQQGLSDLQRGTSENQTMKVYQDRYAWFLALALIFLVMECLLQERRQVNVEDLYHQVRYEE